MKELGKGKIQRVNKHNTVQGYLPFREGQEVGIILATDLEKMVNGVISPLVSTGLEMPTDLSHHLPDAIELTDGERTARFYLERKIYSEEFSKELWFRYTTIDKAIEEGEFDV
jgi:hypothetical protein